MRPSSSSSPQSPQVEPSGRCCPPLRHGCPPSLRVPTGWLTLATTVRAVENHVSTRRSHDDREGLRRLGATGTSSSPSTCSRPACPKHLRDRGGVGGGLRDRALRRGRRHGLPPAAHRRATRAGRSPATARPAAARPRATPSIILEDMDLDGVDVQVMHPNLSLFGLYSDDHELSIAHARVYNDYVVERFSPYFDRICPTAPDPAHRRRRRGRRDRAGRRRRLPGGPAAGHRRRCRYYTRDLDPVWARRPGQRPAAVLPHPDRRREGRRHRGRSRSRSCMENAAQVNQPMTEKAAAKRMVTQAVYSTLVPQQLICQLIGGGVPERYPDLHFSLIEFNAHWLSSLVGGMDKCWVTGIGQDADWWLGEVGRHPPDRRPARHGPAVPAQREVAVPADAERVRAAPVPRAVPGRPGGHRLPAHHRAVDDRVGQRLPARRGHVPRQPGADRRRSSPASPTTSARPSSAARSASCSGSTPPVAGLTPTRALSRRDPAEEDVGERLAPRRGPSGGRRPSARGRCSCACRARPGR